MKKILSNILLVLFVILTLLNLTFLIEVTRNKDLRDNYFFDKPLSDDYLDIEKIHFEETKDLILFSLVLNLISLSLLLILNIKPNLKRVGLSLIIFSIVLFLLAMNFDWFFDKFHRLVFSSENWLLPADSLLIRTYPLTFFKIRFFLLEFLFFFIGFFLYLREIFRAHKRISLKNLLKNKQ